MAKTRNRAKPLRSLLERVARYADAIRIDRQSLTDPEKIEIADKKLSAAERARWIISSFRGTDKAYPDRKRMTGTPPKPEDPKVKTD